MIGLSFDSPDLYHVQDEGTILRKLLAIFSMRPTYTQLTSYMGMQATGYADILRMSKTKFVNIPIINLKLPAELPGNPSRTINLERSLSQPDYFIEHKTIVPKIKNIIYSDHVAFFYANRKYPSANFASFNINFRCLNIPTSLFNPSTINKTHIIFPEILNIGKDLFALRSVILLQRSPMAGPDIAIGCCAAIRTEGDPSIPGFPTRIYLYYNPAMASYIFTNPDDTSQFTFNKPITEINEYEIDPKKIGFRSEAQERGTIFFYSRQYTVPNIPC